MAVQQRKKSTSRRDMRRAHDALSAPALSIWLPHAIVAPEMGSPREPPASVYRATLIAIGTGV